MLEAASFFFASSWLITKNILRCTVSKTKNKIHFTEFTRVCQVSLHYFMYVHKTVVVNMRKAKSDIAA